MQIPSPLCHKHSKYQGYVLDLWKSDSSAYPKERTGVGYALLGVTRVKTTGVRRKGRSLFSNKILKLKMGARYRDGDVWPHIVLCE
jgi:hypothetical protein